MFRPQQIPHLPAHQRPGPLRMLVLHQSLPDLPLCRTHNRNQRQTPNLTNLRRNPPCRHHQRRPAPPDTTPTGRSPGRKPDLPGPLQSPQGGQAGGDLRLPPAIAETEISTQTFGKRRAMRKAPRIQKLGDMMHRPTLRKLVPDLVLNIHADTVAPPESNVQHHLWGMGRGSLVQCKKHWTRP